MLLRDARSTGLPAFAEVVQVGDEKIAQERVEAQGRERPVENRLCRGLVEALERFCEGARVRRRRVRSGALVASPFEREPGCLSSGKALILVGAHAPDSLFVRLRVEPKTAGRTGRL